MVATYACAYMHTLCICIYVQVAAFRRAPSPPPLDGQLVSAGYHPFLPLDAAEGGVRAPMAAKRPVPAAIAALLEAPMECM